VGGDLGREGLGGSDLQKRKNGSVRVLFAKREDEKIHAVQREKPEVPEERKRKEKPVGIIMLIREIARSGEPASLTA